MTRFNKKFCQPSYFMSLLLIGIIYLSGCTALKNGSYIYKPIEVRIIDESRIDNQRVRHIFGELLINELVKPERSWLILKHNGFELTGYKIDYTISYNLMEYSSCDVVDDNYKLIAAIKIIDSDDNIKASYVESAVANDVEKICNRILKNLSPTLVNQLSQYRQRIFVDTIPEESVLK